MEPKAYESPKTMRSETRTPFYGRKGAGFEQTSARAPREAQLFSRHREQAQNTHSGVDTKRTSKVFMPRRKNKRRKIISNDSENKNISLSQLSQLESHIIDELKNRIIKLSLYILYLSK